MADEDRRTAAQPAKPIGGDAGKIGSSLEDTEEGFSDNAFTGTEDDPVVRPIAKTGTGATDDPGLLSNFVQRTDNDFHDVEDTSLIGDDLPEEDEDEADR